MKIVLCSQSPVKTAACKGVFGFEPDTIAVDSGINPEQPVGALNGMICAKRRVEHAIEKLTQQNELSSIDAIFAIENGIEIITEEGQKETCLDVVHIVVYDVGTNVFGYIKGGQFEFEKRIWEDTLNNPKNVKGMLGWSVTVGETIADTYGYDKKNWTKDYNVFGKSCDRVEQITSVLKRIWSDNEYELKENYLDVEEMTVDDILRVNIRYTVDKPVPGVLFQDLSPIWGNPNLHRELAGLTVETIDTIMGELNCYELDYVVGLESRGFGIAHSLALKCKAGFVMVRKPGKQFGETWKVDYGLEYGGGTLELQKDLIRPGSNVLIVDDLLATGGSLRAAIDLISNVPNVKIIACVTLLRVENLYENAKEKLSPIKVVTVL